MKPRDQVAPRERHAEPRTVVERDSARARCGEGDELPALSNERSLVQALDGGLRGAGLIWPPENASSSVVASGSVACSLAAMQSVGTTSKPTAGKRTTLAARASPSRARVASRTAVSPVMSR